jgi:hypothetical protein
MERLAMACVLALCTTGCFPGSGSETSEEEAVQVGRWVEADTTTFGSDNVMGLLANGAGGAKIFYVGGSSAGVFEVTAVITWDDEVDGQFALRLECEERHRRDANGGNRQPDSCQSYESFNMLCPVPDAGDGAAMTCSSPTTQWQTYPFRWLRTPSEQ